MSSGRTMRSSKARAEGRTRAPCEVLPVDLAAAPTVEKRRTSTCALEEVEGRANGNDGRITSEEMHTFQKH